MRSSTKLAAASQQSWHNWLAQTARSELPPAFLCPILRHGHTSRPLPSGSIPIRPRWTGLRASPRRWYSKAAAAPAIPQTTTSAPIAQVQRQLPAQCPGCGAFSQTQNSDEAGFFNVERGAIREYLTGEVARRPRTEDDVVQETLAKALEESPELVDPQLQSLLVKQDQAETASTKPSEPRVLCDRCHNLLHHKKGNPIYHPTIEAVADTLDESPYKHNHVYHVLDAADFPMSLIPRIHSLLDLSPLRSRNRRASHVKYYKDRLTTMSFVITRSDLFAPHKDQVDGLMPWITETLRDALGRAARDVRLGNIKCVSGKKNWWTGELKEDVWKRGGATWMVGKANVGKSYLFSHVFPKGRMAWGKAISPPPDTKKDPFADLTAIERQERHEPNMLKKNKASWEEEDNILLPPARSETEYPDMPIDSALPGTTASPIRLPFGDGRGELIDMPGLPRTDLSDYVRPEHRESIIMQQRIQPVQTTLKGHWDSLLLGGLIRITPQTKDLVFLTYNFTPLKAHRTFTGKAVGIQEQTADLNVETIALPGIGDTMKLAGSFPLKYDVTRQRAGPLTRKDAAKLKVHQLPFRVYAIDILIEGVGWVEVVAQVRTKDLLPELPPPNTLSDETLAEEGEKSGLRHTYHMREQNYPVIDVFSPEGRCISSRRPLNAWLMCAPKKGTKARPKKSMVGDKKRKKILSKMPARKGDKGELKFFRGAGGSKNL